MERRGINGAPSQPSLEANQVTLTEAAEQPGTPDPTEAIQLTDQNEQRAGDPERRGITEAPRQPSFESHELTAFPSSPEKFIAPDPTKAAQLKDENEQRAADAERRGISGAPSQPSPEANQVTLTEAAQQRGTPDPTEAIQLTDQNEQRAGDPERRGINGAPSQSLSEAGEVTTLTESPEGRRAPDPTEPFQSGDENEQRATYAQRRDFSGTPSQPLSETSETTTLIDSPEEPTAGPIEALHSDDGKTNRVAKILKALKRTAHAKRGIGEASRQLLSRPSEVSTLTASLQEPSRSESIEALNAKDADKDRLVEILRAFKRSADAKRHVIGGTSNQPLSAQAKVRGPTVSPKKTSAAESAEAFHPNDADKDSVVKVLKALMKSSQGR